MRTRAMKSTLFQLVLLFVITISMTAIGSAQVVYDWSSDSKTPGSYPRVTRKENVSFTITNVNDILFSYKLSVTQNPIDSDDFKHISTIVANFAKGISGQCGGEDQVLDAFNAASKAINEDTKLPIGYAKSSPHISVPLADSVEAWRSHAPLWEAAVKLEEAYIGQGCSFDPSNAKQIKALKETVLKIDKAVNGPHLFVDSKVLSPGNNFSAEVSEWYGNEQLKTKTFTFPGTDILTLSAGALFSRIPNLAYEARKTPNAAENILTVEGNSKATPSLLALLNYSLGGIKADWENFGLALSAGPVIRLGGKSEASSFGFFSGVSAHLARRFFVTPGIHFGQFSDFPAGFGNGSVVPANFGELKPVKRWTARFGLGITFKTKDFGGLVSSEKPAVTGNEASSPAKPKETPNGNKDAVSKALVGNLGESVKTPKAVLDPVPNPPRYTPRLETSRETGGSIVRIRLQSSMSSTDDRITIIASSAIRDYITYFKGGRFYFLIQRAQLDGFRDDDLRGHLFSEPLIEKRGDDLVLSIILEPGARISISEHRDGLDLIVISANAR